MFLVFLFPLCFFFPRKCFPSGRRNSASAKVKKRTLSLPRGNYSLFLSLLLLPLVLCPSLNFLSQEHDQLLANKEEREELGPEEKGKSRQTETHFFQTPTKMRSITAAAAGAPASAASRAACSRQPSVASASRSTMNSLVSARRQGKRCTSSAAAAAAGASPMGASPSFSPSTRRSTLSSSSSSSLNLNLLLNHRQRLAAPPRGLNNNDSSGGAGEISFFCRSFLFFFQVC